ncbi:MAG: hypothetical protein LBD25_08585 [Coriobacteriales bacterium]|jgi:hypothetical protein|nr:hypothetical protein [Coriobacteriales bacterium]
MNIGYLDTLPEALNAFNVALEVGEKVVFAAEPSCFGNEKDRVVGGPGSKLTVTNKRIIANNGPGNFTVDIAEDVASIARVKTGRILKSDYISLALKTEIVFDDGKQMLTGFHFYLKKIEKDAMDEIVNRLNS